jgi:hypothetical protein
MSARPRWRSISPFITKSIEPSTCYLTLPVEGEQRYSTEEASEVAQQYVDILNLFLASCRSNSSLCRSIGVLGQPVTAHWQVGLLRTPPLGEVTEHARYHYSEQRPPCKPYEITPDKVARWNDSGLQIFIASIECPATERESGQRRIARATTWYARATNANSTDEQFVCLTAALESLLIGDPHCARIKQRLADVASTLLDGDFDHREAIRKKIGELYEVRSDILHRGEPVQRGNLIHHLDHIVVNAILAFVRRQEPPLDDTRGC